MKRKTLLLAVVGILVLALAAPAAFGATMPYSSQSGQSHYYMNGQDNYYQQYSNQNQWYPYWMMDYYNQNDFGFMGSMMGGGSGSIGGFGGSGHGGMMGGR